MTDLPYCTRCDAPRIAVFELGDGTTRCTMCIEEAIDAPKVPTVYEFLQRIRNPRQGRAPGTDDV